MGDERNELRACPTRPDGREPLMAHAVGVDLCESRQAGQYHKCWSCLHHAAGVRLADVPPANEDEVQLVPVARPAEEPTPSRVSLRAV